MMISDLKETNPKGWVFAKLGDVLDIQGGSQPPKLEFVFEPQKGFVQLLQIRDFGLKPVPTYVPQTRVTKFCKKEDVLIARYGASLGRIVTGLEGAYNVALAKVIDTHELFLKKYLFYLLKTSVLQMPLKMISRSAQNGFAKHEIAYIQLPLPPLAEQHRIVAKIEELFSELDKGIENLKTARVQLKVYRQALLKHAFEGKLTADWREQNKDKLETSAALQQRIQTERTARYQEQLTDWQAAAQTDSKPKTPKPLSPLTNEELAKLPYGWITINVESLFNIEDGDRGENYPTKNDFSDTGHCLFLNAKNVTKRGFAFEEMSFITGEKDNQLRKGKLKRGDIVFTSRGTLGNIAHYNETVKHEHIRINSGMFIIRDYDISLAPDFLYYHLNAPIITSQIEKLQTGTAQPQLPIREFKSFRFVIPGKEEQLQIVQELETKLSEIDQLNQSITTSLLQSQALRQSILKKAFSGTLVAQDANDEPASVLLARIKAEKAALATTQQLKPIKIKRSLKVNP